MIILLRLLVLLGIPCFLFFFPLKEKSRNKASDKQIVKAKVSTDKKVVSKPVAPLKQSSPSSSFVLPEFNEDFDINDLITKSKEEDDFL